MKGPIPFHPGEREAQFRFNADWSEHKSRRLAAIYQHAIDDSLALWLEGLPFFFLATADADGNCDCSFKGTEAGPDGEPAPAVQVHAPRRLVFPDYAGNRMFNSLGNILTNPHVGLLFIDFPARMRLRVNGRARIDEHADRFTYRWPHAQRLVWVDVEQVYWNCNKRIPSDPRLRRPLR